MTSQPSKKRTNINIHNTTKPSELGSSCLQQRGFPSLEKSGCSQSNKAPILCPIRGRGGRKYYSFAKSLVQILTRGNGYQGNKKLMIKMEPVTNWRIEPTFFHTTSSKKLVTLRLRGSISRIYTACFIAFSFLVVFLTLQYITRL